MFEMRYKYFYNYYVMVYHANILRFGEQFETLKEARNFARIYKDCDDVHIFKVGSYGSIGKELKVI